MPVVCLLLTGTPALSLAEDKATLNRAPTPQRAGNNREVTGIGETQEPGRPPRRGRVGRGGVGEKPCEGFASTGPAPKNLEKR